MALCQHEDLLVDRFELMHQQRFQSLAGQLVRADIQHRVARDRGPPPRGRDCSDPWDFEEVYAALHDFARGYPFDPEHEDYLVHITTGTHVAQICLFLLTESRHLPGRLMQTSPPPSGSARRARRASASSISTCRKYDRIATRFAQRSARRARRS